MTDQEAFGANAGVAGERAAIEAVLARQDTTWAEGDAAGFAADTTDDVSFTNIVGMFSVGRAPFEAQHAHIFATIYRGSRLRQTIAHLAFPRIDVAIVDSMTEVRGFNALPPGVELLDGALRTRLQQVLVKEGDGWRVAAFHNVTIHPAAGAGADVADRR